MNDTDFDAYFAALSDLDNASWRKNPLPESQNPPEDLDPNADSVLGDADLFSPLQRAEQTRW